MTSCVRRAITRVGLAVGLVDPPRPENRTVYVANQVPPATEVLVPEHFPDNTVVSSKYTAWNFVPKNLFEQFRRIANFYFLCVGVIQLCIPDNPVSPATSVVPLVFVIAVTAIKQGYEDWLRHRADNEVNNRSAYVVRDGQLTEVKSMEIRVGDIVKVKQNEGFPCDCVMLSSFEADGQCYVTTANLDGETNLKCFYAVQQTRDFQTPESFHDLRAVIECQQPITDLYRFIGRINVYNGNNEPKIEALGPENVLLRGARLRNTPFIYASAIYTGQETKMALNSKFKSVKRSQIERSMNTFLIVFLIILLVETIILTALKYWYSGQPRVQTWFQMFNIPSNTSSDHEVSAGGVINDFFAFLVLDNYVIPISLYVTVELQKFFGSLFFQWDVQMFDDETNQPAKANTSDLNEELGQVEYLFTDKTGTLTENDMQFRQCSINGTMYVEHGGMLCENGNSSEEQPEPVTNFTSEVDGFFTVLSLCHTVRVDRKDAHDENNDAPDGGMFSKQRSQTGYDYDYHASSPDEKAFVEACRRYGVVFHGTHNDQLEVSIKEKTNKYKLHHVLEFDPTRKRMSVIVENENGEYSLLCKGAESALLDRAAGGDIASTLQHVNDYAVLGLRTLVIAHKQLTAPEFEEFNRCLQVAKQSLENREEKLSEVYDIVERNVHILGATAVEDRLQDGVPQTIQAMRLAGIKVWVLTGDKQETAVNISFSAGHFYRGINELHVTKLTDSNQCAETLVQHRRRITDDLNKDSSPPYGLVVDGQSLAIILQHHADIFVEVCRMCTAVLCCRMTPIQKAKVVQLIKHCPDKPVTAAIGDGANDVSMIQEAHVGLGIMGKEGRQAARCSDYAFGKFRFLQRALLVHGHYFYARLATLVQYFFYKNVAFITAQIYYAIFSGFSAQTIYESYFLTCFNVTFTSLPILIYGLFEQYIKMDHLMDNPALYKKISRNSWLSFLEFFRWNFLGFIHSVIIFFGVYAIFVTNTSLNSDGKMLGNWEFGGVILSTCVFVVNIKLFIETRYWNGVIHFFNWFTIAGFFVLTFFFTEIVWPNFMVDHLDLLGVFRNFLSQPSIWFTFLLLVTACLLPDICIVALRNTFSDGHGGNRRKVRSRTNSSEEIPLSTFQYLEPIRLINKTNIEH